MKQFLVSSWKQTVLCSTVFAILSAAAMFLRNQSLRFFQRTINILVVDYCAEICLSIGRSSSSPKSIRWFGHKIILVILLRKQSCFDTKLSRGNFSLRE
jgi:hypothetical protein